jgi:RNA 3'-terminal phosphate cyclase (ATP)
VSGQSVNGRENYVLIDGSYGEGGGQILRTAVGLSAVTGKPVKITNIRIKRKNPGLQRQHITAVKAVMKLSKAIVKGLELGSTTLYFEPTGLTSGEFFFDIGTAGSVTLVFQALLPILPFLPGPTTITVRGGTDVPWSPTIDYVRSVVSYFLERMGSPVSIKLLRRGHYPRGGGLVTFEIEDPPGKLRSLNIVDRGKVIEIRGVSHARNLPRHVAERQARSAKDYIEENFSGYETVIDIDHSEESLGPGSGITLWALCENSVIGADSLGKRGKPAEIVGREAASKLVKDLLTGRALDTHMGDIIIPLLALAVGKSVVGGASLTMHAVTNVCVVERMLGAHIRYEGEEGKPFRLYVEGIGLER